MSDEMVICKMCKHYVYSARCFGKYDKTVEFPQYDMCKRKGEGKRRRDPVSGYLILVKPYPECRKINKKGNCPSFE